MFIERTHPTYEDAITEAIRLVERFGTAFQVIEHVTPRGKYKGMYWGFRSGSDLDATIATFPEYPGQVCRIACLVARATPDGDNVGSIRITANPR